MTAKRLDLPFNPFVKHKLQSVHTLTIQHIGPKGIGVGYIDNHPIHIPYAVPKDIVTTCITKRKHSIYFGQLINIVTPSPLRLSSPCPHFPQCGGCRFIDISYEDQLVLKHDYLLSLFKDYSPQFTHNLMPVIGSPKTEYYRNKMEFSFSTNQGHLQLGLKERGQFDRVVSISSCRLQQPETNDILSFVCQFFNDHHIPAWDPHTHTGLLRHLVLRYSTHQQAFLLNLVVSDTTLSIYDAFCRAITTQFSSISSVYLSLNDTPSDTAFSTTSTHLYGEPYLIEQLDSFLFKVSPYSFFQTNTSGAEVLYNSILSLSEVQSSDTVLDLYCGTGTIGLFMSPHVNAVIGVEENPMAIQDAHANAKLNHINNISFFTGRVKNILKFNTFSPDCVIVDPPRCGMVPKALRRLLDLSPSHILYVSCNPSSMCQDISQCLDKGYTIQCVQPIDMFPNTYHLECIVRLSK